MIKDYIGQKPLKVDSQNAIFDSDLPKNEATLDLEAKYAYAVPILKELLEYSKQYAVDSYCVLNLDGIPYLRWEETFAIKVTPDHDDIYQIEYKYDGVNPKYSSFSGLFNEFDTIEHIKAYMGMFPLKNFDYTLKGKVDPLIEVLKDHNISYYWDEKNGYEILAIELLQMKKNVFIHIDVNRQNCNDFEGNNVFGIYVTYSYESHTKVATSVSNYPLQKVIEYITLILCPVEEKIVTTLPFTHKELTYLLQLTNTHEEDEDYNPDLDNFREYLRIQIKKADPNVE